MAEFELADGYAVNVFASEEQFPELRNPVQIAFDARGRLWVVTMPSFPHTVPGLTPPDKIVILEDTDKDGKADTMKTFAEGLDALDGVAFHRDGVIISEQPRLWLMRDTDGDDKADVQIELLRGIDVTDSHHGGMIAADPFGDVIFSDGVFHRSQLETPFGVHRGVDATTYRLNPNTGKIVTEWQHITPNPWNVTFDQWGNIFQTYGDGDTYDGTSLIWTPLGAYHPYAYGKISAYGKGSANAIISSPNFPDQYDQGLASASLLGRYAVNINSLDFSQGMIKPKDPLPILTSPNAAFRPADVEFGMDGALYVSDFCSPIIGHAQHAMRSTYWDHDFGRIWRVVLHRQARQKRLADHRRRGCRSTLQASRPPARPRAPPYPDRATQTRSQRPSSRRQMVRQPRQRRPELRTSRPRSHFRLRGARRGTPAVHRLAIKIQIRKVSRCRRPHHPPAGRHRCQMSPNYSPR